jgi:hypothetical protein
MGLNGKAVLPMVLGLGCVTMATMPSRILETRKERVQVTLLLALAIPCSAQLGVILGMIGVAGALGVAIWGGIVARPRSGYAAGSSRAAVRLRLELPPMRVVLGNILVKTLARWRVPEGGHPLFIAATVVLFVWTRPACYELEQRCRRWWSDGSPARRSHRHRHQVPAPRLRGQAVRLAGQRLSRANPRLARRHHVLCHVLRVLMIVREHGSGRGVVFIFVRNPGRAAARGPGGLDVRLG